MRTDKDIIAGHVWTPGGAILISSHFHPLIVCSKISNELRILGPLRACVNSVENNAIGAFKELFDLLISGPFRVKSVEADVSLFIMGCIRVYCFVFITNRKLQNSDWQMRIYVPEAGLEYDDVIKWKYFPRYWPFARGIHRSPVNSPYKGQWRGALMFSLICVWINIWINNRVAGDLRRYRAHYDVIVMKAGTNNYNPQIMLDVVFCLCTWCLIQAHKYLNRPTGLVFFGIWIRNIF